MSGLSDVELPAGWAWAPLRDICIPVKKVGSEGFGKDRFQYIDIGSVNGPDRQITAASWIESSDAPGRARQIVKEGDTLYSTVRPYLRKIARVPGTLDGHIASTGFAVIRPHREINSRYIFHAVQDKLFEEQLFPKQRGVSYPAVRDADVFETAIPIPPMREQQRIVEALEGHLSRIDAASRSLSHAQALIPLQRRALYTAAAEGRIANGNGDVADFFASRLESWRITHGEKKYREPVAADPDYLPVTPQGWKIFSLEALTDPVRIIRYGILMPKVKSGGTVPYVEVKDLKGCSLHEKKLHLTSAELDAKFAGARIQSGDVLLAVRGSYDRSAVVSRDLSGANVSRDVARIAPLPGIVPEYLHIYLQSGFSQRYLKAHARGVAVKGVNIASIRALPVAVPSVTTQMKIVEACQQQLSAIDAAEKATALSSSRCMVLRKALLTRAFSGELVHQDLTEEPAFVILDRIRAESEAQGGKPRRAARRLPKTIAADTPPPPPASSTPSPTAAVQQELPL